MDLDLFVIGKDDFSSFDPNSWSRLYLNEGNGTFTDITRKAGFYKLHDKNLSDPGWEYGVKMGASWGDFNNDQLPDLLLTNYQSIQLFKNLGNHQFSEITGLANLPTADNCYNSSGLWWDFNKDGLLDLFVSKWGGCESNRYFENTGNETFIEKTITSGLGGKQDKTWMAVPMDINQDQHWDLYLANDFSENELFIGNDNATFQDEAPKYLGNYLGNDMGIALGDYNFDGNYDLFITNIGDNRLLSLNHLGQFENVAKSQNVSECYWAWGTQFADFDLDKDLDLFVANGYQSDFLFYPTRKENFFFVNQSEINLEIFADSSEASGLGEKSNSMSTVAFDYDLDGDLDLFVSNMDDYPFFYENTARLESNDNESKNFIKVLFEGMISNKSGLGSEVILWAGNTKMKRLYHGAGLLSQNLNGVHFGLNDLKAIDSIEIIWDSGTRDKYFDLESNRHYIFQENIGFQEAEFNFQRIYGCTDPYSCTFQPDATVDDGTCQYLPSLPISGPLVSGYFQKAIYEIATDSLSQSFHWNVKNGEILSGQGSPEIEVLWELASIGSITVQETNQCNRNPTTMEVVLKYKKEDNHLSVAGFGMKFYSLR